MTSSLASATLAATASPANVPSRAHQREASTTAPLSRGHVAHVRQIDPGLCRVVSPALCLTTSCELGAGFGQRPFHPHSRLVPLSSPGVWTNRPVRFYSRRIGLHSRDRAVTGCGSPFHSATSTGSRPAIGNTLADQHFSQRVADRLHHHRPFKASSSAGFKTSWKDLTCEAEVLSPDDKIHD
jgi:hypothetical protein